MKITDRELKNWISKRSLTCIFQSAKFEADKLQCRQLLWRKEFWTALKTCLRVGENGFLVGTVLITYFSLASIEIDKHIAGVENGSSFNKPVEARCIWYSRQYNTKAKCKNLTLTHFTEIPINFRTNSVKNRLQNIFCTKSKNCKYFHISEKTAVSKLHSNFSVCCKHHS